uniref:Uncharacterized protein n=1 Tax=Timema poppense TaxID=170557 RepID=A0A7R9H5M6_TIMPO|nr:unnamed protein product [Timema poppensis]
MIQSNGHSPHMDKMMNNMKACEEERGVKVSEDDIESLKNHACPKSESFQCLLECATNKTNLVSKDGKPDYNAFEEEVNTSSAPEDMKSKILSKAKACFTNCKETRNNVKILTKEVLSTLKATDGILSFSEPHLRVPKCKLLIPSVWIMRPLSTLFRCKKCCSVHVQPVGKNKKETFQTVVKYGMDCSKELADIQQSLKKECPSSPDGKCIIGCTLGKMGVVSKSEIGKMTG